MSTYVNINRDMINWAIERSGLDLSTINKKIPDIDKWLDGTKKPTVKQLELFSKKVFIPFGYLFLNKPPKEEIPIPFYRTNIKRNTKISINLIDAINILINRQNWLREYLIDIGAEKLNFVGSSINDHDIFLVVNKIKKTLGLKDDWAAHQKNWVEALQYLIEATEKSGIIVVASSVVGNNNHRKIKVDDCRGFVLVDDYAPFIFINAADSKSAQMFTLAHELAHIWIGKSAGFDFRNLLPADDKNEQFCNKVAAEFLVPKKYLEEIWEEKYNFKEYSKKFKVSEIVIARRALDIGKISKDTFMDFYNEYINKDYGNKIKNKTGGNFFESTKKKLSPTFSKHIKNAVESGNLLYREAYYLTGLWGNTFEKYMEKI